MAQPDRPQMTKWHMCTWKTCMLKKKWSLQCETPIIIILALLPGMMWSGHKADHSPPSSVTVKN